MPIYKNGEQTIVWIQGQGDVVYIGTELVDRPGEMNGLAIMADPSFETIRKGSLVGPFTVDMVETMPVRFIFDDPDHVQAMIDNLVQIRDNMIQARRPDPWPGVTVEQAIAAARRLASACKYDIEERDQ